MRRNTFETDALESISGFVRYYINLASAIEADWPRTLFKLFLFAVEHPYNEGNPVPMSTALRDLGPMVEHISERHRLSDTRDSITHKFSIMGHEGYLTIGLFENGMPGELFVKMSKEGSTLSGLMQGYCRAFSLALQYGLPVDEAVRRFKGMRFEPMGHTSNPDIPEAMSILDYVAKYLELHFVNQDANEAI